MSRTLFQPLSILCLIIFFSWNIKDKFNDLGMARGRHIKSCKKKLRIAVMNTRGGKKSNKVYIFLCSRTSSSCYNFKNKQLIFPCSGTRCRPFFHKEPVQAHSFTSQASCWSLRTPCKEPQVRKFWPYTYSLKTRDL